MKRSFYIICLILICTGVHAGNLVAKGDTTDSWSVVYNGKEILGFKIDGNTTYIIDSIADNGLITVDYYTEHPCPKCQSRLQFRDENGIILATVQKEGFGEGEPFRLPGKQFRQIMRSHKLSLFFSANPEGWGTWVLLGVVKTTK
jgi:hypothetical protein